MDPGFIRLDAAGIFGTIIPMPMKDHDLNSPGRALLLFITIILLFSACPRKPPSDVQDMVVVRTTRVIFQFNRPITVGVLDEGALVKARPTSEAGWFEVWWRPRDRWKFGYVEADCLKKR